MFKDENRHYSLRKLSVGLASVLIGISFASMTDNSVHADTVESGSNSAQTVVKGSDAAVKIDAKDDANAAKFNTESAPEATKRDPNAIAQDIKQEKDSSTKNDSLTANNHALKDTVETAKQGLETPSMPHGNSNETTLNVKGNKAEIKENQALVDPAKSKLKMATLMTTTGKRFNTKMLFASKAVSPANDTNDAYALDSKNGLHEHANVNDNGGYDSDFWGKINVDDWNYTVNGDRIEITGLKDGVSTGANDAVIVPNLDDFKLAGKDGGAKSVYISKNTLGETAKHKYYGLSKTNGNKFATDSNLSFGFYNNSNLTHADLNSLNTSNVIDMIDMFSSNRNLTSLDVSKWDTSNVTDMSWMFNNSSKLTDLDVSKWNTGKVTDMSWMFFSTSGLTSLDVSKWDTSNVTDMHKMFDSARSLTSLDVSKWDTSKVTDMSYMFYNANNLALIVKGDKFADYLVKNNFADSRIDSGVKSVTTDNTKLLQLLTNDVRHDSSTRTITFTFPANYSPDLAKYHLTKNGNTYQIKQSADYATSYAQGTVLINATGNIAKHHIDTTKSYKLSNTWKPNYNKLVLAHKNADGTVSFNKVQLPKIPRYKAIVKTVSSPVNHANALFAVSFMALPKPVTPTINDVKPDKTVTTATPVAIEIAKPIKTELKVTTPVAIKTVDLSDDTIATTPKETTWRVADKSDQDTYYVSNGKYTVELPHISNAQLHIIANDSTKDSILFTYKEQKAQYAFNIKFVNGHYLLTTYKIKSGKLVKLIDYNFIKSSKMIDVILDWLQFK